MADNDMLFGHRAVIEFLVQEEIPAAEIHQRLQRSYGSVCMGASGVRRWVKHFKDGNRSIQDEPRSGRPRTVSTERNQERVDEIIQDDRRVTVDTIARRLGIGHNAVQEMIESLGYRKVYIYLQRVHTIATIRATIRSVLQATCRPGDSIRDHHDPH